MRRTVLAALLLVGALTGASGCSRPATMVAPDSTTASAGGTSSPVPPASPTTWTTTSGAVAPPTTSAAAGPPGIVPTRTALPDVHLPGVNDPSCLSAQRPVVLLPGTFSTVAANFTALAAALQADGRCVFGLNYGLAGVAPVRDSATAAAAFVDEVRTATGADQVDVVAFSQGGLVLRAALRLDGLAPSIGTAVLIAPTFHGSTSDLLGGVPAAACPACADQTAGSTLLAELNAGGDLDGDLRYATISSRDDSVVTPVAAQSPVGPDDRVTALIVQDRCPAVRLDHLDLPGDPSVIGWVRQALDTDGRPDPSAYRCR